MREHKWIHLNIIVWRKEWVGLFLKKSGVCCDVQSCHNPYSGEALNTASNLINQSPSKPLNGNYPGKMWSGKEASFKHSKTFASKAFIHEPKGQSGKLDHQSKSWIFLGYGNEEFGYGLLDPEAKMLVRSRDVISFEDQTIEDFEILLTQELFRLRWIIMKKEVVKKIKKMSIWWSRQGVRRLWRTNGPLDWRILVNMPSIRLG